MNVSGKAIKHVAPGPYLGFSLQQVRLCFHLLDCPAGASVSLELLDDVAIHYANGKITLEQTKSATKTNPLTDWSSELWKAISNWIDGIATGHFDLNVTNFRIYVTPVRTGDRAKALNDAKSSEQIAAVAEEIRAKLGKPQRSCDGYVRKFLNLATDIRKKFVAQFSIQSDDNDPVDAIRRLLQPTVSPALIDILCKVAIGMAKETADALLRKGEDAIVSGDEFKKHFIAFVRQANTANLLTSFTPAPHEEEVKAVLLTRPVFIRQLEIIDAPVEEHMRAVSDFLRTSADKSDWAEGGVIFDESFSDWDDALISRHELISNEVEDEHGDKDEAKRGRMIYRRCAVLQAPLEGRVVPLHFVHGSYNNLANDMELGWHPDYERILEKK